MRLIITRHGETEENKAGVLQGHLPGKLSSLGIEQAKKLALRLKDEKIDYIFSSDLARSADTAKEIAKYHPNTPIEFVKELRERDVGEFQGKTLIEIGWTDPDDKNNSPQPTNGETKEMLYARAKKYLHKILLAHQNHSVLLVAHDFINQALMGTIMERKSANVRDIGYQDNTSVNIFEIDENKNHEIICSNCTAHLGN